LTVRDRGNEIASTVRFAPQPLTEEASMDRRRWIVMAALAMLGGITGEAAAAGEESARPKGEARAHADGKTGKVNINDASKAELMKLDGVGPGAADRIIAYRVAHGPFKRVQDLEKVDKLGKAVLDKNPGRLAVK
jgi:competence ComEA-like helix-hairpin-helix protein